MKQALNLQLGQQLTLTPQLQQAIRLLQLSTLELTREIQDALESNPLLEHHEEHDNESSTEEHAAHEKGNENEKTMNLENENMPQDLPVDAAWEDAMQISSTPKSSSTVDSNLYELTQCKQENLQEFLLEQVRLQTFSEEEQAIATAIIDAINESGFLSCPLEEIQDCLAEASDDEIVPVDEIECVLHRLQTLGPTGVGARDLQECLILQLKGLNENTPFRSEALTILTKYFHLLASKDYKALGRKMKLTEDALKQVLLLIQSLDPRPGSQVSDMSPQYITPDVTVSKHKNRWLVELNNEALPKLRINNSYMDMIGQTKDSTDNSYLKNHLQEARWLIKSLTSRNETLLKVATCIFEYQKEFLEKGEGFMKPLVLKDIAEAVGMHESTISRVTTQKYADTPRGIFELKYFFSSHVTTADGGECSATAIRARIKALIAGEDLNKPLSDNKIASILEQEGINVARRTVAKYREAMHIPSSNERKSLV